MRVALAIVAVLIGAAAAALISGSWSWKRSTQEARTRISAAAPPSAIDPAAMAALPPPVARYFTHVLGSERRLVSSAVATQEAEFFINDAWRPLKATQHFRASPPAFVWDATIDVAPLMPAYVRDSYIDGIGTMRASLYGRWSLADQSGTHELNLGALQRFLGEAVWFPTALLPSPAISWQPRDERSATATLRDRDNTVALLFEFDDAGLVRAISGDRFKEVSGNYVMQRWEIVCGEPAERSGMIIPTWCEVAWVDQGVRQPYWRGRITTITYEY